MWSIPDFAETQSLGSNVMCVYLAVKPGMAQNRSLFPSLHFGFSKRLVNCLSQSTLVFLSAALCLVRSPRLSLPQFWNVCIPQQPAWQGLYWGCQGVLAGLCAAESITLASVFTGNNKEGVQGVYRESRAKQRGKGVYKGTHSWKIHMQEEETMKVFCFKCTLE